MYDWGMQTNNVCDFETRRTARKEQMLRELASDIADLVRSGDMTDAQANERG